MTRLAKACLGGALFLTLILVAGSALAATGALISSSRVTSPPARLGGLRVAVKPERAGVAAARSLAQAGECSESCFAAPAGVAAVAVAVAAPSEAKKEGSGAPPVRLSGAAAVRPAPSEAEAAPVEPEVPPAPEQPAVAPLPPAEPEPPVVEPEAPAVEPELPSVEPEAPSEPEVPPAEPEPPVVEPEAPAEPPEPPPDPGCPLGSTQSTAPIAMGLLGCEEVASDTSSDPDPLPFWGAVDCADQSRYAYVESGGDTHPTATGAAQPDSAYRKLTVDDGDEVWGERCELGLNDHRTGPTAFYHQGEHRVTYLSERLPANYPLANPDWQTVMQMKQAQPADGGGEGPILEMQAREDKWVIVNAWNTLWTFPARTGSWTRFAWDVYYSQDPSKGWLQVSADLNGDGDFNDPGERSPVLHAATLKTEIEGPNGSSDGLAPGDPIPSHLRVGIYHDPEISCAAPVECSVEVDNVQVLAPAS